MIYADETCPRRERPVVGQSAPLFLFGFERSGTTLLAMLFGAHPAVAVPFSTTGLWYRYYQNCPDTSPTDLAARIDAVLAEDRIKLWDFEPTAEEVANRINDNGLAGLVDAVHSTYAAHKSKPLWGNSDINTLDMMHLANAMFPKARFIHIVRDVRDVVLSNARMPYAVGNTLDVARSWYLRVRTNLRMGAMIPGSRYVVVRYEDLLAAPETTLRAACKQIGLGYDPRMLEYAREVDSKIPEERRWLWPKLGGALDAANAGRWRRELGAIETELIREQTADLLSELGYPVERECRTRSAVIGLETWYTIASGDRFRRLARNVRSLIGF